MTPTFCEDCINVEPQSRKGNPYNWLCVLFPRLEGGGFVSQRWWAKNEPFMRCNGINGGACPKFERKKEEATDTETNSR